MKAEIIFVDEKTLVENFKSKWLIFRIKQEKSKTVKIVVGNKYDQYLGIIEWYPPFRQYSFEPASGCMFAQSCQKDILLMCEELEKIRENRCKK